MYAAVDGQTRILAFTHRAIEATIDPMTSFSGFSILRVLGATFLGLALIVLALPYMAARNERARLKIENTRQAARLVLDASSELSEIESIGKSLPPFGGEFAISIANIASNGKLRVLREAAGEARDCMSEIGREYHWYELVFFSLPVDCRSMYDIIAEASEAGQSPTSTSTPTPTSMLTSTVEVSGDSVRGLRDELPVLETNRPPLPPPLQDVRPTECTRWQIKTVKFTVPPRKPSGMAWDFGIDGDPDPMLETIVAGREGAWPEDGDSFRFSQAVPLFAASDEEIELRAVDRDLSENDPIVSTSFTIQDIVNNNKIRSGNFEVTVVCRR